MNRKTLFITGASSGIGAETARAAVAAGWNVGAMARRAETLDAMAEELGAAFLSVPGDVTDLTAQEDALARVADHFGGIDAAFANAGKGVATPGTETGNPAEWREMIDLNIMALLYTTRAALPHLRKTRGHLVLTGSVAGKIHIPGSIYGATKWFVHGYAGNMAQEMREWGGRCTLIAPGMVDTPFFSEAKPDKLKPEDIAQAVIYALSQPARASVQEVVVMPTG
ncbi:MAG: SDR family oxidoreductase [Roseinatronobacter sp.]